MIRPARGIEQIGFQPDALAEVLTAMARLAAAGDGWINLVPRLSEDKEQSTYLRFGTMFGGGSPGITMSTWVPGRHDPRGDRPATLGISHTAGTRAVSQLATSGVAVPGGWLVEQDHRRRGLVLRLPIGEPDEEVLVWALRALSSLSAPEVVRAWRADVHLPTT